MGAICQWCHQDMMLCDGCTGNEIIEFPDGKQLKAIPYSNDYNHNPEHRCHDCNVKLGVFHHPGCDMERCPNCGGQLISCGCLDEPEEE